jgi:hypothetical protein
VIFTVKVLLIDETHTPPSVGNVVGSCWEYTCWDTAVTWDEAAERTATVVNKASVLLGMNIVYEHVE